MSEFSSRSVLSLTVLKQQQTLQVYSANLPFFIKRMVDEMKYLNLYSNIGIIPVEANQTKEFFNQKEI
jgi:hypothetical protein